MSDILIKTVLENTLIEMGVTEAEVRLERPRDPDHGDWATNLALTLASRLNKDPREIAQEIVDRFDPAEAGVERVEIAGPGFLNFRLSSGAVAGAIPQILAEDEDFGRSRTGGGEPFMVEFVSANPTGPLHLGHGRQAALGDAIASLLEWTGWAVHREYYYNDAGRQIELLAESVWARYQELLGEATRMPDGGYHGEYVRDLAQALVSSEETRFKGDRSPGTLEFMRQFAVRVLREEQDRDLSEFGVTFDRYFLESSLYSEGLVESTIQALEETGLVYERDGALWLRSTEYGDQKDRVMVKGDGSPTYFLPDVAYHLTKWERGFRHVINVQGSDHHGTVARVRAGLQALGLPEGYPEYVLHQMVTVIREGEEAKISKRAGSYTTVRELFTDVGADVARYFLLMRKPEAHLMFDLDVALDQSEKNPVFKIQYAHARMCSIFRKGEVKEEDIRVEGADLAALSHPLERDLIKRLADFPETVERAARARAPHTLSDYLEHTAGAVNSWYHEGNPSRNPDLAVLVDEEGLRKARLALARSVRIVLRNGLEILGVSAPTRMDPRMEAQDDV
jgi:arginyl-tRNA synthetase